MSSRQRYDWDLAFTGKVPSDLASKGILLPPTLLKEAGMEKTFEHLIKPEELSWDHLQVNPMFIPKFETETDLCTMTQN